MKRISLWTGVAACLLLAGCATGVDEDLVRVQTLQAFDRYKNLRSVAVIPFGAHKVPRSRKVVMGVPHRVVEDNGKVMCDIFTDEFRKKVKFKVIRPEKVAAVFTKKKEKVWGFLAPAEARRVGELLGVDALLMGQVDSFSRYQFRMYEKSKVAVHIRMSDTTTGELIWKGEFSLDQEGKPHEVARRGCRLLIDQLMSRWGR